VIALSITWAVSTRPHHWEIAMNIVALPKRLRTFEVICVVLIYSILTSIAHATMLCSWFSDFGPISDPSIQEMLEAHLKALPGLDNYEIVRLDEQYFMVEAAGKFCKEVPRCEHRLLELRVGVVKNVFAFEGTGKILQFRSPLWFPVQNLGDEYSAWAFETTINTYIRVNLPRFRDMIFISSPGQVEMKTLRACDGMKR
jgi:hypothetical protein